MYKEDLALNNLQWLICHKTKPDQTRYAALQPWWIHSLVILSRCPSPFTFKPLMMVYAFIHDVICI